MDKPSPDPLGQFPFGSRGKCPSLPLPGRKLATGEPAVQARPTGGRTSDMRLSCPLSRRQPKDAVGNEDN